MTYLEPSDFADLIRYAPLVSIDLIVRNDEGQVLLGKRTNAPAQGFWFTPGGRIYKDEKLPAALSRVIVEELGIEVGTHEVRFIGVYDHIYPENVFGDPTYGTHYVVLAHELLLDTLPDALPTLEHSTYRWWEVEELVTSSEVHPYTRAYF
jgi:colanic acid biosynthesis protein WcaH